MLILGAESQSIESTFSNDLIQSSAEDEAQDARADENTAPQAVDRDEEGNRATIDQVCPKCKQSKAPSEFVSDKTGRPVAKCRTCMAPKSQIVRDNHKRKAPASRKEEIRVLKRVKVGERKLAKQTSAIARDKIKRRFGGSK